VKHLFLPLTLAVGLAACGHNPAQPTPTPSPTPTPACSYTVSPASLSFPADGGSAPVEVKTAGNCPWTSSVSAAWVTLTGSQTATGDGTLTCTAAANPDAAQRSATLTVAGQSVTVNEAARACSYTLSAASRAFGPGAEAGAFDVATLAGCAWTAATTTSWIQLRSPADGRGSGPGSLSFAVDANPAFTSRTGTIGVEGLTFTVTQEGRSISACTYTVQPTSVERDYRGTVPGNPVSINITADEGCPWTANPAVSWLGIGSGAGSGSGSIAMTIAANDDLPRNGALEVRWPTATAGQNVWVTQGGCSYMASCAQQAPCVQQTYPASGGSGRLSVWPAVLPPGSPGGPASCDCHWVVSTDVAWISLSRTEGCGDNDVAFTVQANPGTSARSGTITISGQQVTISQQGR
jgi:hypothetical protein